MRLERSLDENQARRGENRPAEHREEPVAPSTDRHRILLVDDNQDLTEALALLLETTGADVRVASNGPTALEVLVTYAPTVVMLDLGLPGMSGYEVAKQIRLNPKRSDVTLVALTGWGSEADKQRSKAAGFDHHVTKPVGLDELQRILDTATR